MRKMPYKDKEKERQYRKEYYEKNKDKIKEKGKEHYNKNKDRIRDHHKKYYEKNKYALKEKNKEWREKNKNKIKEHYKYLYAKAINRICNYYELKKPICFIDKKGLLIKNNILKNNVLIIDHKQEQETELKDKYKGTTLYNHIITCPQKELENYQLLCSNHNFIKHDFYSFYLKLKNKNSGYAKEVYEMYNEVFIYDKGKLRNELIKEEKNI